MSHVNCPECAAETPMTDDAIVGEIVQCPDCGSDLEVTGLEPVMVAVAPELEEDWGE